MTLLKFDNPPNNPYFNSITAEANKSPWSFYLGLDYTQSIPEQEKADYIIYINEEIDVWKIPNNLAKKAYIAFNYPSTLSFIKTINKGYQIEPASVFISRGYIYYKENSVIRKLFDNSDKLLYNKENLDQFSDYLPKVLSQNYEELELERIKYITRINEWSNHQKIEALKHTIKLILSLTEKNLFLADPHVLNIAFNRCNPIYLDINSIHPIEKYNKPDFINSFFNTWLPHLPKDIANHMKALMPKFQLKDFNNLLLWLENIKTSDNSHSTWSKYSQIENIPKTLNEFEDYGKKVHKFAVVYDVLKSLNEKTLVDVGCNKGFCSFLASLLGYEVIGFDNVADVITEAHIEGKWRKSKTTFAVIDILSPQVGIGLGEKGLSFPQRAKSDVCLAAAVTHHFSLAGKNFDEQAKIFSDLTKKYLLVEFIPAEFKTNFLYNMDEFITALKSQNFEIISIQDSSPLPRKWILAKKV